VDHKREQLLRAAGGDLSEFRAIWHAHRDIVYRFACWMTQDAAAADDITQESFLSLLEHPTRFDSARATLRTFLLGIARNLCRTWLRRHHAEIPLDDANAAEQSPAAIDQLAAHECSAILNAAVAQLPPLQREALFLFEYEDLSLEDAARVAGVDVGTFKSRLHRARQRLKRELHWLVKEGF
jgi:RNA polymerase sigma-70 factor (ECF subfamily)